VRCILSAAAAVPIDRITAICNIQCTRKKAGAGNDEPKSGAEKCPRTASTFFGFPQNSGPMLIERLLHQANPLAIAYVTTIRVRLGYGP